MKGKRNSRGRESGKYGVQQSRGRRTLQMMGKKRGCYSGKHRIRGSLAIMLAFAAGMCLIPGSLYAVQAQAGTHWCDITLTPSEPASDNGNPDVYGYYDVDSEISVDIFVSAHSGSSGIQKIEYWITDGVDDYSGESSLQTLYEDFCGDDYIEDAENEADAGSSDKIDNSYGDNSENDSLAEDLIEGDNGEKDEDNEDGGDDVESDEEGVGTFCGDKMLERFELWEDLVWRNQLPASAERTDIPDRKFMEGATESVGNGTGETEEDAGEPAGDGTGETEKETLDEDTGEAGKEMLDTGAGETGKETLDTGEDDPIESGDNNVEESGKGDAEEIPDGSTEDEENDVEDPGGAKEHQYITEWEGSVSIDLSQHRSGKIRFLVRALDFDGNVSEISVQLAFDRFISEEAAGNDSQDVSDYGITESEDFPVPETSGLWDIVFESEMAAKAEVASATELRAQVTAGEAEKTSVADISGQITSDNRSNAAAATGERTEAESCIEPDAGLPINPEPAAADVSGWIITDDEDVAIFTGDQTEPEIRISGVEDGCGYSGTVLPEIEVYDRNFSECEIILTRTSLDEVDVDVTDLFFTDWDFSDQGGDILGNALEWTPENDGIYTLRVRVVDQAGNESEETVTFSVNRFGSAYVFSDYLVSLIQDGGIYTQEVDEDLVITEYNVDRLVEGSRRIDITRDGKPVEDVMCEITENADGWYEYRYTIDKGNFAQNGVYKMTIHSLDEAGNISDAVETTGWEILFRVDNTAPEIIGNVKTDEAGILTDGENFVYSVYDTMGLHSIDVYLNGESFEGEITDFEEDANNYSGSISIAGSVSEQDVRLVATDLAGNISDINYSVPSGVRTLRQALASPGTAIEELSQRGISVICLLGAAAAAVVILILLGLRGKFNIRRR